MILALLASPAYAAETHPGGTTNQIQYNNAGYFGGIPTASVNYSPGTSLTIGQLVLNFFGTVAGYIQSGALEYNQFLGGYSGSSLALNIDNGNQQSYTINGSVAISITPPTHPGKASFIFTQDGTGWSYSITGCKWPNGTAITYSSAPYAVDIVSIMYDGANLYCMGGAAFQ